MSRSREWLMAGPRAFLLKSRPIHSSASLTASRPHLRKRAPRNDYRRTKKPSGQALDRLLDGWHYESAHGYRADHLPDVRSTARHHGDSKRTPFPALRKGVATA